MRILTGALAADAGTITRRGRPGYCPQQPVVYERQTCDEHFELFGRAYGMTAEQEHRSRHDLYQALGFGKYAATRARQLSGGTLAKLNLGLAVLPDPQVLLLDEPYAGFDFDTYQKFWDLVAGRRAAGRSVLIISHFVTTSSIATGSSSSRPARRCRGERLRPRPAREPAPCSCTGSSPTTPATRSTCSC